MKLYYNLIGYRRLSFEIYCAADIMNLCMKYGYPYCDIKADAEQVSFVCSLHTASRITRKAAELGIAVNNEAPYGLPIIVKNVFRHPGLLIGILPMLFFLYLTSGVVWDIRISGNERLSDQEIIETLDACNFRKGTSVRDFKADYTESMAQLYCDDLAWISINMKGSVAYVEVREKLEIQEIEKNPKPANIVASVGGTVVEIIAYDGIPLVKAGDNVKAGELLISGVYGENAPGLRVTRAAGYVKARTVRHFEVEIPYSYEQKQYTGKESNEKSVIFFGKSVKLFLNSSNLGSSCDKIEKEKCLSLFGTALPVSIRTDNYREYVISGAEYTPEQARLLAMQKLEETLEAKLYGAEIISRNDSFSVGSTSLILECEIICFENIEMISEFEFVRD